MKKLKKYVYCHLINIRFEKKKHQKLTKNSNICTWSFDLSKVSKSVGKNHKSEGKTFLQANKPNVIINNALIKSYENFFFQNFSSYC